MAANQTTRPHPISFYEAHTKFISTNDEHFEKAFKGASIVPRFSQFSLMSSFDLWENHYYCEMCGIEYPNCHIMMAFKVEKRQFGDTPLLDYVRIPIDCPCIHRVNHDNTVTDAITEFLLTSIAYENEQSMFETPPTIFADTKMHPESLIEDYAKIIRLAIDFVEVKYILELVSNMVEHDHHIDPETGLLDEGSVKLWMVDMINEACCSEGASNVKPASR
jgi:hypothetical protein